MQRYQFHEVILSWFHLRDDNSQVLGDVSLIKEKKQRKPR